MVKRERFDGSDDCKTSIDRISALPDDVLGLMLSLLTLKEAMATSILCRRWKYMWALTPKLDFDGTELLGKMMQLVHQKLALDNEKAKFVRLVDGVIAGWCSSSSSSSTSLEEFRVFFDLTTDYTKHIDEWLSFAASRKVERLELNFLNVWGSNSRRYDECFIWSYEKRNFPSGFSFIKKLSTHLVNVSGEALEVFLGNSPLLEQVSVSRSGHLKTLSVIRTFAAFKCLEISLCFNLTSVVIRDSNVEILKYKGKRVQNFLLINVPLLTELWIGGVGIIYQTKDVVEMFSSVFPQLQMLKIYYLSYEGISWKETEMFSPPVNMCNLKQLVVNIGRSYYGDHSLLPLMHLVNASPNLQRFMLQAPSMVSKPSRSFVFDNIKIARKTSRVSHQLKEVEFAGYHGMESQFELIKYLVENFVTLENIVVGIRGFDYIRLERPWEDIRLPVSENIGEILTAAKEQLSKYVPSRINMKILI